MMARAQSRMGVAFTSVSETEYQSPNAKREHRAQHGQGRTADEYEERGGDGDEGHHGQCHRRRGAGHATCPVEPAISRPSAWRLASSRASTPTIRPARITAIR